MHHPIINNPASDHENYPGIKILMNHYMLE